MKRIQRIKAQNRRRGFTLTEVLLVLAIIGVIAAMVVPNLIGTQKQLMIKTTQISLTAFEKACEMYAQANGAEFPQGGRDEVLGLLTNPGQDTDGRAIPPYLPNIPKDAWGQPLNYEYPSSKVPNGIKPAIWSSGPNKQNEDGGGDDINNWSKR